MKQRTLYLIMAVGGFIGMAAAFLQLLEVLVLLQDKSAVLPCNINSIFSCSTVLNAWQSSVFGFPNAIMCLTLFTIFTTAALMGAGGALGKVARLSVQGLSLFTLGFALWSLWEDTYVIGALCIFCLICFVGLLILNWSWLRLNVDDLPVKKQLRNQIKRGIAQSLDIVAWIVLGLVVVLAMLLKFLA